MSEPSARRHVVRRIALACVLTTSLLASAMPVGAVTPQGVLDDDTFVWAPPLLVSPQEGDLGVESGDVVDRFLITVSDDDVLTATLTGPAGQDFDLSLYSAEVTSAPPSAEDFYLVTRSKTDATSSESISFLVPPGGDDTYYLEVRAFADAQGAYSLTWSVEAQAAPRLFGLDRYRTSYSASRSTFPTASVAVVASGANFPDALSSAGLAGAVAGPVLLAPVTVDSSDARLEDLVREVVRLGCTKIYVVGGIAAVTEFVADTLAVSGNVNEVERIGGPTRYQTSALVAQEIEAVRGDAPPAAFVVRGNAYPDALAVSPYAYANALPILLTSPVQLDLSSAGYIEDSGIDDVVIAGGVAAVSSGVEASVRALNAGTTEVQRMYGADRYATAATVAEGCVDRGWGTWYAIGVATGANFPDALSGGSACGARGGVLLLTTGTELSPAAEAVVDEHAVPGSMALVFGGAAAVAESVRTEVAGLLP